MRDVAFRRVSALNFIELGRQKIPHVLYRFGFIIKRVSCRYLNNRGRVEDPCDRDFRSTSDEKFERDKMPSGFRDRVQKNCPFFVVQAFIKTVYDDDCWIYDAFLGELAKRFKNELL